MIERGIYCIKNTVNNKVYIGSSKDIIRRTFQHFRDLKKGTHINKNLQRDFNIYGIRNFIFHILEEVDNQDDLLDTEFWWINNIDEKELYNIATSKRNRHDSISQHKRILSEQTKNRMSIAKKGKPLSEQHKKAMSESRKGKTYPQRQKPKKPKKNIKKKSVKQINKETNEIIKVYPSITDASKETGIQHSSISNACNGKYTTAGGFKWNYN